MQQGKKALLIELRHSPDEEYDEDAVLNEDNDSLLMKEDPSMFDILFTLHGAYIILSLGIFLGINYALDVVDQKPRTRKSA